MKVIHEIEMKCAICGRPLGSLGLEVPREIEGEPDTIWGVCEPCQSKPYDGTVRRFEFETPPRCPNCEAIRDHDGPCAPSPWSD